MSGLRRLHLTHLLLGLHSPVGQRHLAACRLKSDPAKVQKPCSRLRGPTGTKDPSVALIRPPEISRPTQVGFCLMGHPPPTRFVKLSN
jgi:hypothetical protein